MAIIKCAECGKDISNKASSCPNCGAPVAVQNGVTDGTTESKYEPKKKTLPNKAILVTGIICVGVIACLFVAFGVVHQKPASTEIRNGEPPVTLINEIQNIPSSSVKTLSFTLPYSGYVTIKASVVRGNDLDMDVLNGSGIDALKNNQPYTGDPNFSATKTRNYLRTHALSAGIYSFVLKDNIVMICNDTTVHVRASSWKTIPLALPYMGYLTIRATVLSGNDLEMNVLNSVDAQALKNDRDYNYPVISEYSAPKTRKYARISAIKAGNYCFLLKDNTMGILSEHVSDAEVNAILSPSQTALPSSDVQINIHLSPTQAE